MNVRILLGIVLIAGGLLAAAATFGALGRSEPAATAGQGAVVGDENRPARSRAASMVLPVIAGLSLAAGGALIGIGIGRFSRPKVVSPDSRRGVDAPGSPPTLR
jgi:hypothetical protein